MGKSTSKTQRGQTVSRRTRAKSLGVAERGINTSQDFANVMGALMVDLLAGRIAPNVGNAMCNAGGKMLKAVEMQLRYGKANAEGRKELALALTAG